MRGPAAICRFIYLQVLLMSVHLVRDDLHHLIVAATAAGGAVGNIFHALKGGKYIVEIGQFVKSVQNVAVADLLAVAHHIVLSHIILR